jgi:signal transduction histidine kinase
VDNAIKFTDHGQVAVSLESTPASLTLTVDDTGRGIPVHDRIRVFTPFESLEDISHKHTPGVGLGLALVKRLTEGLGGTVSVASHAGAGSRFVVTTPALSSTREVSAPGA